MSRLGRVLVTAAGALLLIGCSSPPPTSAPTGTPSASNGASPMHEHEHEVTPFPSDAPGEAPTPVELAHAAMVAYVDHSVTAEVWYEQLAGLLSAAGQQAHYGTDPAEIPATTLVGEPRLADPWTFQQYQTDYLALVEQDTDAGLYRLLLSRADSGAWQIEWIRPAQ